ncbi:OadG family protein [bacterium]|nr:OadG family protein [bacterium]
MNIELFFTGLKLMVIGMGIVFTFLVVMIFAMQITTRVIIFINKFFPEEVPEVKPKKSIKKDDAEIAIAIALAMREGGNNAR